MPARAVLYSRDLPGGGYVAIDVQPVDGPVDGPVEHAVVARPGVLRQVAFHHARLWVERRADPSRRTGHTPPIIAQCTGPDLEHAMAELRAIAADNVALAQAMRRWSRRAPP